MKRLFLCGTMLVIACGSKAPDSYQSTRAVSQLTPELAPVVAANNAFAWSLYGALGADVPAGNLFYSPFSVTAALAMTYAGARGQTASEMKTVLNIVGDDATYHAALGALFSDLGGDHAGRDYQLYLANRLYAESGYSLSPDFRTLLAQDYQATPANEPFSTDPETARQDINGWVNGETRNAVPELFPMGSIDSQTRVVLANALYFKANWATGFDPKRTESATFYALSGDVPVQMMSQTGTFSVTETDELSLVELDYQDHELSLLLLVPRALAGLSAIESELGENFLNDLLARAQPGTWALALPRFDLTTKYQLREALTTLGMPSAFDAARADFTGISDQSSLYLADVFHAAYVHIDESGTVAAAATGTVLPTRSTPRAIAADHPFVFVIRDKLTGAILFVGRVTDPS